MYVSFAKKIQSISNKQDRSFISAMNYDFMTYDVIMLVRDGGEPNRGYKEPTPNILSLESE